jgi:1,4-dihydroxy-2-naphthoate polyprenyltransferase
VTERTAAPTGLALWVAGARPRTLGAAVAPVVVGTAAGSSATGHLLIGRAALALVVGVAIQVGANYANDYSDGVRGADANRVGPLRLTASGLVPAPVVRRAAVGAFGLAAVAGLALSLIADPWLVLVGVAAIAAAVLYTGGPKPYGYLGLGEVMVLAFFGFAATAGSAYVQAGRVPVTAWWASLTLGLLACGVLLANNVRDRVGDTAAGKRTLAVRLGDRPARLVYVACLAGAFGAIGAIGVSAPWVLLALAAVVLAVPPARVVLGGETGPGLIPVLVATVRLELVVGALLALGLWLS